ncbi:MAG: adenosine kinase [Magnetococcales bacterium]|nr:adenosine kinase [Magnetococcales bacterium]
MSEYDVYGVGHALVDMEFKVDDAFLDTIGVEKGTMALVDHDRQEEIVKALTGRSVERACGGSAANSIIGVAQFGGRAFHACKVAADEAGDFFASDMKADGVNHPLDGERQAGATGRCLVLITPDAERTLITNLGISELVSPDDLDEAALKQAKYLYVEGYLVSSPSARAAAVQALEMARAAGVKTALTFSDVNMIKFFRDGFEEMIGSGLDLIFCNEAEALEFTGADDINSACQALRKRADHVAITLGNKGAVLHDGQQQIDIPGIMVDAVDTNGAGDMFAGAFLYGITQGFDFEQAGKLACQAASVLVTQFGARLKSGQALDILKKFG